jgi:hypothetical protein
VISTPMKCSTKFFSGLTVTAAISVLAIPEANAVQYQKLMETGGVVTLESGGTAIRGFSSIGIDDRKNVAAKVSRDEVILSSRGAGVGTVIRPFFIRRDNPPVEIVTPEGDYKTYYGLRIAAGRISIAQLRRVNTRYTKRPNFDDLVVGSPSNLEIYFSNISGPITVSYDKESIALAGSSAFIVGERSSGFPDVVKPLDFGVLRVESNGITSVFDKNDPIFRKEGPLVDAASGAVSYSIYDLRASTTTVLLSRLINGTFQVFEKNGVNAVKKIYQAPAGKTGDSKICGFAVSQNNVVLCSAESQNKILVRFGAGGALKPIQLPNLSGLQTAKNPSISQETVIFELTAPQKTGPEQDAIYISEKGAPAQRLIGTNDKLNGKVIQTIELSDRGQSLANRAFVFTATFTDGSTALYRGTL